MFQPTFRCASVAPVKAVSWTVCVFAPSVPQRHLPAVSSGAKFWHEPAVAPMTCTTVLLSKMLHNGDTNFVEVEPPDEVGADVDPDGAEVDELVVAVVPADVVFDEVEGDDELQAASATTTPIATPTR